MPTHHKNIRLGTPSYIGQSSYFVTICCAGRRPIFAEPDRADWLVEHLRNQSVAYRFSVYAYCVMPDHFHALLTGLDASCNLLSFMRNFKQITGHDYLAEFGREVWQKKFYDHIVRPKESMAAIAGYIWMNPVRKGLCSDPRAYAHSGSFVFDWKRGASFVDTWVPVWKKARPA